MNDHSSRSHTIFTLTIESRLRDEEGGDGTVKVASLVSIIFSIYMKVLSLTRIGTHTHALPHLHPKAAY